MKLGFVWNAVHDSFLDKSYGVSPRFGYLIEGVDNLSGAFMRFLRFSGAARDNGLSASPPYLRCDHERWKSPLTLADERLMGDVQSAFDARQTRSPTLFGRVQKAARLGLARKGDIPVISAQEALPLAGLAFESDASGLCLEQSLSRFALLIAAGLSPHLCIGAHIPTDSLHAWVELDQRVLFEHEDIMVHYQTALRYDVAQAR